MRVWVVTVDFSTYEAPIGVFSSLENAEKYIEQIDCMGTTTIWEDDLDEPRNGEGLQPRRPDSELPQFDSDDERIDITKGMSSEDFVRQDRDGGGV